MSINMCDKAIQTRPEQVNGDLPVITIVTVVFNGVDLLEETIHSVAAQSYPYIEYIIIDGGSVDGTLDIIKKYENHISYWVSEKDFGIYDAMNKGIEKATGKWINYLNAGDVIIDNNFINSHINLFVNNDLLAFSFKAYFRYDDGVIYSRTFESKNSRDDFPTAHNAIFFPLLKSLKYNLNYKISSDFDYYLQHIEQGYSLNILNDVYMRYLIGGISEKLVVRMLYEKYLINIARNKLSANSYLSMLYKVCKEIILQFVKSMLPRRAIRSLKLVKGYISEAD